MSDTTDLLQGDAASTTRGADAAPPGADAESANTGSAPASGATPARTRRRATSAPGAASAPRTTTPRAAATRTGGGLAAKVLPELQAMAGELGISGIGRMRKSQLIEAIQAKQGGGEPEQSASAERPSAAGESVDHSAADPSADHASPRRARVERTSQDRDAKDRDGNDRDGNDRDASNRGSSKHGTSAQDGSDRDGTDQDGEDQDGGDQESGDRPERVDRGRERFLEREARRQERAARRAAGEDADGDSARGGQRNNRTERPNENRGNDAQGNDTRGGNDNRGNDTRPDRDNDSSHDRDDDGDAGRDRPQRQQAGQNGPEDEDGRRGRFRERGRGRNRNRNDRYGSDYEPAISDDDVLLPVGGILDILDNYAFVRTSGYLAGPNDVYVTLHQVRKHGLRRGDAVTGVVRQQREGDRRDKYNALVRLDSVNGQDVEESAKRPDFGKLTPLYPDERLRLETEPNQLTTRVIDLVAPIGKGQRALIVSPPKAGKTVMLQAIANAITTNNPECHLMVVLVDERPEEVTDMQRSVKGEVIASTFDRPPTDHITVAELSIERAKRLVELGHDVVVLLDSVTRLGRAYNLGAPASGRILTGGVDSAALYPPKRFLGAARNIENGGSLTIFATALVETGSAMDTVIFEEFKGTGNAEIKLDLRLADKRIFPSIDVAASGTRKEELLLSPEELRIVHQLRRVLNGPGDGAGIELLLDKMSSTRTNVEFLMQIKKSTPSDGA